MTTLAPDDRSEAAASFIRAAGWGDAARSLLAGDASNRRYDRLSSGAGGWGAVLMDAPSERGEDLGLFLAFTGHLRALGFSAPEVYAADPDAGFAIVEDLGDDLYARVCAADPALEAELYAAAVDLLAALRRAPPPEKVRGGGCERPVSPYDGATLRREARLVAEWWAPAASGAAPSDLADDLGADLDAMIDIACADVEADRSTLALRDYHAENLLWLPGRTGAARVGLIDYQDALAGAAAYDLVSLLEDARRDTSPALRAAMRDRYAEQAGVADRAAFDAAYAALGAQRNLKIVGIFARLWVRDGKAGYLDLIPRVWAHLERDLSHPALGALAAFVAAHIPAPEPAALARVRAARS
ncbi:MAG: phosphotransferase [Pseudomonadota bacterium]